MNVSRDRGLEQVIKYFIFSKLNLVSDFIFSLIWYVIYLLGFTQMFSFIFHTYIDTTYKVNCLSSLLQRKKMGCKIFAFLVLII